MKSLLFSLAALATLAATQNFDGQPSCAVPCLKDGIPKVGCKLEDVACACQGTKQAQLMAVVGPCILNKCGAADIAKAQAAASAVCLKVAVSTTSMMASGSPSASGSSAMQTMMSSMSGMPMNSMNSTSSPMAPGSRSTMSASRTGSMMTPSGSPTMSGSGSRVSGSASPTSSSGAGLVADSAAGALAAAVAAAAAFAL